MSSIFGPSRKDIWKKVTGKSHHTYTRVRAPFVNPTGFRFRVYRKSLFSDLGKRLGMEDIEVGDPDFNDDFIVQASDRAVIRRLLSNATIRDLIGTQKDINLTIKDDEGTFVTKVPDGVDELHCVLHGAIDDLDRLKHLYDLFAETLDELSRIGVASDADPEVRV